MFTWWVFYGDLQPGDEFVFFTEPIALGGVYFLMIKNEIEMFFTHKKYYPKKYVSPDKYISKVFRLHKKKIPKFLYIQAWKCIVLWFLWIPNFFIWEYFNRDLDVYSVIFVSLKILFVFDLVILFIWTSIWSFTDKHQTGRKILKRDYRKYPWNVVHRYESTDKELVDEITIEEPTKGGTYMFTTETVQNGSKGASTRLLQKLLKAEGYFGANNKVLTVDGDFGANTLYALKNYQRSNGLFADGICGPLTWAKIIGL